MFAGISENVYTMETTSQVKTASRKFVKKLNNISNADYCGLQNQGETCYLNSILQVFFMTKDFREAIESCGDTLLDLHLKQLFKDLIRHEPTDPYNITQTLRIQNVFEQQDAAEYFEKILIMASPDVSRVFKGQLRYRTTCCKCFKHNEEDSPFWTLPLPVDNVNSACLQFFETSKVNQMYCDGCKIREDATIECSIEHYPDVLTLLLKRFEFDYDIKSYVKIHRDVDVPQTLLLKCNAYELYAIVDHSGSLRGGHYTATIKSYDNGNWYEFNDAHVRLVYSQSFEDSNILRSANAYLLMYRKRKDPQMTCDNPSRECIPSSLEARDPTLVAGEREETDIQMNTKHCNTVCDHDMKTEDRDDDDDDDCGDDDDDCADDNVGDDDDDDDCADDNVGDDDNGGNDDDDDRTKIAHEVETILVVEQQNLEQNIAVVRQKSQERSSISTHPIVEGSEECQEPKPGEEQPITSYGGGSRVQRQREKKEGITIGIHYNEENEGSPKLFKIHDLCSFPISHSRYDQTDISKSFDPSMSEIQSRTQNLTLGEDPLKVSKESIPTCEQNKGTTPRKRQNNVKQITPTKRACQVSSAEVQ